MADLTRKTENIYDKYNTIEVEGLGTRYGQYVEKGIYSIYNDTDNTVIWGTENFRNRYNACGAHSTATIDMTSYNYSNYGFMMAYNDASLGDVSIVEGSTVPDHYIPYWQHSLRKMSTATETIQSGDTIYANGQPINTYSIKGNTVQNGTPTPSNPVAVNGVGERTENLFDKDRTTGIIPNAYINQSGQQVSSQNYYLSYPLSVESNTVYTWNFNSEAGANHTAPTVAFYDSSDNMLGVAAHDSAIYHFTFTTPINCTYIRASVYVGLSMDTGMLLQGSVSVDDNRVIPFIPYGFKIPISTAQTVNNYLGSIQSTRQINKIVFDGTKTGWDKGTYAFYYTINDMYIRSQVICTHYEYYDGTSSSAPTNSISTASGVGTSIWIKTADHDTTTLDQWKAYLQAQYAAGTPVTVYYVLATEETGVVNEPLMKIGTYADSISNTAAIPTTEGANSITVDTTVQPSEFSATWTGWHDSSVQEYQGGVGNQKFDKSTAALGYRVLYTTGEIGELSPAFCSDFIPVVPNTTYTLNVVGNLAAKTGHLYALYDSDKEFVDTGTHASVSGKYVYTFTIPSGIAYIRFNGLITNIDETMLNEGETALPYEPYEHGWA